MEKRVSPVVLDRLLQQREKFLGFLQRRVESSEVAEDILQGAFLRGIEKGGELRDEESAVAWFYRLLRNALIDHYRNKAASERAAEGWVRELETETKPDAMIRDVACGCVREVLVELKPEYRQAIEVVDLEDRSLRELAERTGIAENNAGVRVHRAREALRKAVKTTCGACAEHGCVDCRCKTNPARINLLNGPER
jgi:RNA polymerase sigma-70 factor (ECF subfamily)